VKGWTRVAETTLLQRVAKGEPTAVRDTIDRYSALVWSLARRLSPTRADAEDAVQEIFISLWKSADRYDPDTAKESTFVAMIARRRLIDRMRRTGRRPDIGSAELNETLAPPSSEGARESEVINGEQSRIVAEAFRELSQEQQRVLRLSLQHGQSHSQIAESTGIPLGTVKTHARRGLIRLKEAINARAGSHEEVSA
jgi:RNA polymerase sigma-70 factor (ECF subfamily)